MKYLKGKTQTDRRHAVPVLHVEGSHYDVGYDVGRVFGSLIKEFMEQNENLNQLIREYETPLGKKVYDYTLANMAQRFPFYVREIQGLADGALLPFDQLFLFQMDDIMATINENEVISNSSAGCTSVGINLPNNAILGHTEDALSDTLNHYYILSAHIIPTDEEKSRGAKEERFSSLCYAGHLPGYTMGFNQHDFIFSINTLSPATLNPGRTPRTFITRALLGAQNYEEALTIVKDKGLGAANGCSINMFFIGENGTTAMYNVEMAPSPHETDESLVNAKEYLDNSDYLLHVNKYERLKTIEVKGDIIDSSVARLKELSKFKHPMNKEDIIQMLSDKSDAKFSVFQDSELFAVKTIAIGIFDLKNRTWSIYSDQPNKSNPTAVLHFFDSKK